MLSVEQEKQRAVREREESETSSREEVESFRAKEQAIKENNQAIMRWNTYTNAHSGIKSKVLVVYILARSLG